MGKTRHYRPEERTINRAKPAENKPTKYKHDIFKDEDDEYDELVMTSEDFGDIE